MFEAIESPTHFIIDISLDIITVYSSNSAGIRQTFKVTTPPIKANSKWDENSEMYGDPLPTWIKWDQAPVPLSIFRSNSKFDENSKHSSVKYTRPITTIFCTRHDSVTVVTCAKYRCDRSNIFETRAFWSFIEFDRNMLSGTGAWHG